MEDQIYQSDGALIKKRDVGTKKTGEKYWKFVFITKENGEVNMSCFDYENGINFNQGDTVDIDYTVNGNYKNVIAFRLVSQGIREEQTNITEEFVNSKPVNGKTKDINPEFIVNINGKEFITANGLLAIAENEGGISKIEVTKLDVHPEANSAFASARVTMKDGRVFENAGSATPKNLKAGVEKYYAEMSITRAISRCIRSGLNVAYCSVEELSDE